MATAAVRAISTRARGDLDAMRGVAALMVAVFHSLMWLRIEGDETLLMTPPWSLTTLQGIATRCLMAICSGATAVDLFFVLSGFVLAGSLPMQCLAMRPILAFYQRRLLRIWPSYAASLILAGLYLLAVRGDFQEWPRAASWMRVFYRDHVSLDAWLSNLVLLRVDLNPVAWSLGVELVMSACLPVLLLSVRRLGGAIALLQVLAAFIVALFVRYDAAGHFFYLFLLGLYGRVFQSDITRILRCLMTMRSLVVLSAAALLLPGFFTLQHHPFADLSAGLGTLGVIYWISDPSSGRVRVAPGRWLALLTFYGTLSYSFYLCHFIAVYAVAWTLIQALPEAVLAAWPLAVMLFGLILSVALATVLALAMHFGVERPFMRAGRRQVFKQV